MKLLLIFVIAIFPLVLCVDVLSALIEFIPAVVIGITFDDQRLSIKDVARKLGVNVSTVWRWILKGVRGINLSSYSIGGRRYVRAEELDRFILATTDAAKAPSNSTVSRTSRTRDRDIEAAEHYLDTES